MDFIREILENSRPGDRLCAIYAQISNLPFLELATSIPAGPLPWHTGSLLNHMARCMNDTAGDPLAVWMAFVHDSGKLTTPRVLFPHHYGHEFRGEKLAAIWSRSLGLTDIYGQAGVLAAGMHMRAARYPILRPGKKLKLLESIMPLPYAASFWKMVSADAKTDCSQLPKFHWKILSTTDHPLSTEVKLRILSQIGRYRISDR